MKLLCWNCRGFGLPTSILYLWEVLRQNLPEIVCLAETKIIGVRLKLQQLGFEDYFEVPLQGRRGGMAGAWKRAVLLEISNCSDHFVNVVIKSDPPYQNWLLSFVYGSSLWNEKDSFWYALDVNGSEFNGPWVCFGDFNAVVHQNDKYRGRFVASSSSLADMNRFMWSAGLLDLSFSGIDSPGLMAGKIRGLIMECLDIGIANGEWHNLFPWATVSHLRRLTSDHSPILLNMLGDQDRNLRSFRFEAFWVYAVTLYPRCCSRIQEVHPPTPCATVLRPPRSLQDVGTRRCSGTFRSVFGL